MPIDKNNPAYQVARGNIETIVKDVIENGSVGTAGLRTMENIANTIITDNYLFPKFTRKLLGKPGTRKLFYTDRNAWREVGPYTDDRDFTGLIKPQALSEIIQPGKRLSSEFMWDDYDLQDTEMGAERLVGMFENTLMKELNIEIERRTFEEVNNVIQNGKKLVSDTLNEKDLSLYPVVKPDILTFNIPNGTWTTQATRDKTMTFRDELINYMNRKEQMNNPFIYMPDIKNWMLIMSKNVYSALNAIKAIDIVKTMEGFDAFLNNSPIGTFNGVPVMLSSELGMNGNPLELLFIPKNGGFDSLSWLVMQPIEKMYTRSDYIGKSPTSHFFKTETGLFDIMITYWGTVAGIWGVGLNTANFAKSITGYFTNADASKGTADAVVNIDATTHRDFKINIVDVNSTLVITSGTYYASNNGMNAILAVPPDDTKEGRNIAIEIIDTSDTLGQPGGYMVYRSPSYLLINKKGVYASTATIVNDTNESGSNTVVVTNANVEVKEAKVESNSKVATKAKETKVTKDELKAAEVQLKTEAAKVEESKVTKEK